MMGLDLTTVVTVVLSAHAVTTAVFLVSENRSPQATPAWMLAFVLAPGPGVLIYLFFGRDTKAFRQDLAAKALPVLSSILSRPDAAIAAARFRHSAARRPSPRL